MLQAEEADQLGGQRSDPGEVEEQIGRSSGCVGLDH